jgi:hypothetical protein
MAAQSLVKACEKLSIVRRTLTSLAHVLIYNFLHTHNLVDIIPYSGGAARRGDTSQLKLQAMNSVRRENRSQDLGDQSYPQYGYLIFTTVQVN